MEVTFGVSGVNESNWDEIKYPMQSAFGVQYNVSTDNIDLQLMALGYPFRRRLTLREVKVTIIPDSTQSVEELQENVASSLCHS